MSKKKIMRKFGSRLISLRQYKFTDLFLFAVILAVFELIIHFALISFKGPFDFSPMVPIVLIVMMRWGWVSVFYALGDGLLYVLLNIGNADYTPALFAVYIIGNAFIMLLLLMTRFMGKDRIRKKWYFSALYLLAGWIAVSAGRLAVAACFSINYLATLIWDFITPAIGLVIVLIVRRLDGMFEDQRHYLKRLEEERREQQRRDEFGDEPIDIDEETVSILRRRDDDMYN